MLKALIQTERAEQIDLSTELRLKCTRRRSEARRGYSIVAAVLDEVAYCPVEDAAEPNTEIVAALRPGMPSIQGSMLLGAPSLYTRKGALWENYRRHY